MSATPRLAVFVLAAAALIAAGVFAHLLLSDGSAAPPDPEADDAVSAAAVAKIQDRLDDLEREVFRPRLAATDPGERIAQLEKRIGMLEKAAAEQASVQATASVPGRPAARPPEASPPVAQAPSPRSLPDDDLLIKARALSGKRAYDLAAPFWQEVLTRRTTDEVVVEAQLAIGYAHREAKAHEAEEAAFREAMRVAGPDTEKGQAALYQIAWSQYFRDDHASASESMEAVAAHPATPRLLTGHARLNGAHFWRQQNDAARAREALESIVRDFSGSSVPIEGWFVRQAKDALEQME